MYQWPPRRAEKQYLHIHKTPVNKQTARPRYARKCGPGVAIGTTATPGVKMMFNKRFFEALDQAGRIRTARRRACPHCGRLTIVGLDDDTAARMVRTDLEPLDQASEYFALLRGLMTYTVELRNRRVYLHYRDRWRIAGNPADTVRVVAEHTCTHPKGD